ncbi:copper-translocating P-type ATPase [Elioraea tepidiphila]|jgi:Cu2+-exporting ATPase|uniref:heavy metal translocating P-type ATPase n=1 Tax=Elioraea tepidiphila TaxID=457934 RepID=UPI002FDA6E54
MNAFTETRLAPPRVTTACAHCAAPCPDGARFCCAGCAGAHALISGLGLDRFYARLEGKAPKPEPDAPRHDLAARARTDGDVRTLDLMVGGITCAACCWLIEQVLAREPDVTWARVALSTRRLTIRWHGPAARANDFGARIAALGFAVAPFDPSCLAAGDEAEAKRLLRAMGIAAFASMNVMLVSVAVWVGHATGDMGPATRDLMHWLAALIALPAVAVAGMPFFRPAFTALRAGRASLDLPISLGVLATCAMSLSETIRGGDYAYFDSAIMLVFLLLVGRYLDRRARGRAREAAARLMTLNRAPVGVLDHAGVAHPRAPEAVRRGERVLVAPGERIGVDGVVLSGRTTLDESLLTGETLPRAAGPGDTVHAGTLNRDAALVVEARASGAGTLLAAIVRLMERAEQSRSRFVALADRVSRWYTPVVHVLAAGTFLLWWGVFDVVWQQALVYAVAVLIITCPCALGIAVPAVQVAAAGGLMRRGVLITSGTAFERLAQADVAVLDKTGTLTRGRPALQPGAWTAEDLRAAAALAATSRHPLARALAAAASDVPAAPDVVEHPGEGLSCGTVRLGSAAFVGAAPGDGMELFLARPGAAPVRFAFADVPRPDARDAVAALAAQGLVPELLSGDRAPAVAEAARDAGITRWTASADPAAKIARLEALKRDGRRPLMVGDGLNDAPALAAAHVSIAYASGADIAQAAADVVVQTDRLGAVPDTVAVARRAQRLVRQNIAISLGYNVVAVPLAIAGFVTPLIAAVAMAASSLTVILNALRVERRPAWTR